MPRGIILTNGIPAKDLIYHMALVCEEACHNVRDFKLIPVHTTKEVLREEHNGITKNSMKLYDLTDTMLFGETVDWADRDKTGAMVNIVHEYERVPATYESRIWMGETQLKLEGVMSKNRKVLWMLDIWPDLEIPFNLRNDAHPNVVVEAWVTVQLLPNQALRYELRAFDSISQHLQHTVRQAMWNEAHEGNLVSVYHPDMELYKDVEFVRPLSAELTGMKGIVVSEKQIIPIDQKHRNICFHLVVKTDTHFLPEIGTSVTFKAHHLDFLNIYGIIDVHRNNDQNPLAVTPEGNIKTPIRFQDNLPGFYFSEKLGVYMDDPYNLLEGWHFSKYVGSTLQVAIAAGEPSEKGIPRFFIIAITDAKAKKIQEFEESGAVKLEEEIAILVDRSRKLHLPRLPKTRIRIPRTMAEHPVGTVFRVSAIREKRWKVTHAAVDENIPPIQTRSAVDPITREPQILFFVPEAKGSRQMPVYLVSQYFGLIHPLKSWRIRQDPERHTERNFWVTMNDCYPGDVLVPPAKFKYVGPADKFGNDDSDILANEEEEEVEEEKEAPRPLQALNEVNIPIVARTISDEEFERRMKSEGDYIVEMVKKLEKNRDFIRDPLAVIESECIKHNKMCSKCKKPREFKQPACFFPEYLSFALRMRPEILPYLSQANILTTIALRRFEDPSSP